MRRRDFITLLGGASAATLKSRVAVAQRIPVIGFLHSASPGPFGHLAEAFRNALNDSGFAAGRDVKIEYRWAEGEYERLPALAANLVRMNVDVIMSAGGGLPAVAAKAVTSTIPIVFLSGGDPVVMGLVASLNRPGGNVTGVVVLAPQLESKRLGLLRELVPKAELTAVLINSSNAANFNVQSKAISETAQATGQRIHVFAASTDPEIEAAFASMAQMRVGALLVAADASFNNRRAHIIALATHYGIPTIYEQREFALAGGLASYGTNLADSYRLAGTYVARVLRGERPADLPVTQSTKFEFVLNLKTAKMLGLEIAPQLLATVDDAIE